MKPHNMRLLFRMLAVAAIGAHAGLVNAQDVTGAWTLDRYEMTGEQQRGVSGLLVMTGERFAMVYTMETGGDLLSGRAHAGRYSIDQGELVFDVEQWVQSMDGEGSIVPGERVTAELSMENDTLVLRFGSGSVQRWQRVPDGSGSNTAALGLLKPSDG